MRNHALLPGATCTGIFGMFLFYRYFHVHCTPARVHLTGPTSFYTRLLLLTMKHTLICTQVYLAVEETVCCQDRILFQVFLLLIVLYFYFKFTLWSVLISNSAIQDIKTIVRDEGSHIPMLQLNVIIYLIDYLIIFGIFVVTIHSASEYHNRIDKSHKIFNITFHTKI